MMRWTLPQPTLTVLLVAALSLTKCGPSDQDRVSKVVTLEFWTIALGDAFADYIHGIIDAYETEHPDVRIKWVDLSGGEVTEKFLAAIVGETPPDLANMYDLPRFMQYDVLSNMDELVSSTERGMRLENFWNGIGYYQGHNYALPWYSGVHMMWYNREIFSAAGLDPQRPPQTIDEMLKMGRIIRRKTGKYGVSWRLHPSLVAPAWALLRLDGCWPLFEDNPRRAAINTPRALAVFEKWRAAYRDEIIPPEALAAAHRDEVNWFIEGRAAMLPFSGGWITRYFDESFEEKVVVTSQPRGSLGLVPATNQVLVVPRTSRHVREAVDFGLFLTNDENQLAFCQLVAIQPSTKKAAADPYFFKQPETLAAEANRQSALDIPHSFVMAPPDVPGWSRMEDILHEEFARALAGEQDSQVSLERIERKWNHLLRYQ